MRAPTHGRHHAAASRGPHRAVHGRAWSPRARALPTAGTLSPRGPRRRAPSPAVRRPRRRGADALLRDDEPDRASSAATSCSTRATRATASTSSREGKIKLGRTQQRRPGEPAGRPRPRRDVRRAVALRPRPAHRHRHRRRRDPARLGWATTTSAAGCTAAPTSPSTCCAALARRLRRTNEALADLVFSDVPGRVAKALLDLSARFGRQSTRASASPTTSRRRSSPSSSAPRARR